MEWNSKNIRTTAVINKSHDQFIDQICHYHLFFNFFPFYVYHTQKRNISYYGVFLLWRDTGPDKSERTIKLILKILLLFITILIHQIQVDTYGTQQPIALLKLLFERKGFYDRGKDLNWKNLKDIGFLAAMGKAGGGRNDVSVFFIRFHLAFSPQRSSEFRNLLSFYDML